MLNTFAVTNQCSFSVRVVVFCSNEYNLHFELQEHIRNDEAVQSPKCISRIYHQRAVVSQAGVLPELSAF